MSRKDYRDVAKALRELIQTSPHPDEWEDVIDTLARVFKKDNPRFSYSRFRDYIVSQ
ncbi:MAG TPA: hypothetical protein VEL49_03815 [Ktedonobacteraceae bacterium]|nr:hypothetical protein [Ktedonobacteraceae bacterium]